VSKIEGLPPFQSRQPPEPLFNINPAEALAKAMGLDDSWKYQQHRETMTGETKIGNPTSHNPNRIEPVGRNDITTRTMVGLQFREDPMPQTSLWMREKYGYAPRKETTVEKTGAGLT